MSFDLEVRVENPLVHTTLEEVNGDHVEHILFYTGTKPASTSFACDTRLLCDAVRISYRDYFVGKILDDGIASFFRLIDYKGDAMYDGSIAIGCGDMKLDNLTFAKGGMVHVNPITRYTGGGC